MMKTIWTETPKGEEAQQEWIGSQSRHRLPMVQITKNGCLKINKPLQELLPTSSCPIPRRIRSFSCGNPPWKTGGSAWEKLLSSFCPSRGNCTGAAWNFQRILRWAMCQWGRSGAGNCGRSPMKNCLPPSTKTRKNPLGKRRGVPRLWSGFWNGMPLSVKRLSKIVPSPSLSKIAGKRLN